MQNVINENSTFNLIKKIRSYTKPVKRTSHSFGSSYFMDMQGNLYTNNIKTYFTGFGSFLRKSTGKDKVVTLRDSQGVKVSIRREKLVKTLFGRV